jgi:hypothetical protein
LQEPKKPGSIRRPSGSEHRKEQGKKQSDRDEIFTGIDSAEVHIAVRTKKRPFVYFELNQQLASPELRQQNLKPRKIISCEPNCESASFH